jgi:transcriptional regulator with XRE-family HTH domain/adenylate kinase family enzyme
MESVTPDIRPKEWAVQALTFWELQGKGRLQLARKLGISDRSLARWAAGERTPDLENVARTFFHLYAEGCFNDLSQAVDLAWLMGLTTQSIRDLVRRIFVIGKDVKVREFLDWLQTVEATEGPEGLSKAFRPSLPAYYVSTGLARQVKEALLAPRAYRLPLHQVIILHGGPGVGKTTTAACLLRDQQLGHFFRDGTLFIPMASEKDRAQALWRACQQAGLPVGEQATSDDLQQAFHQWAKPDARLALLVLDDPQRAEDLAPLLDVGPQVRILITCQDRRTVARALEERWEPISELVLWQAVSGLSELEGLKLLRRWQSRDLPPEEDRARRSVGELLRWHPAALCLYAGEAHAANWQTVEALVLEGNLHPDDFGELAGWIAKSWERLSPADQEALSDLRRILREASTFGTGLARAVWNQELPQAALRIGRLEDRGLIERVSQEPQPWQAMIQQAYGGEERYRLMPLLRLIDIESYGGQAERAQPGAGDIKWLQAIERRAKALPMGPAQIPWQYRLANLWALPVAWLQRRDTGRLEERLMNLWNRQGMHPPAEVWLAFQKSRWTYLPLGYVTAVCLILVGAWYLVEAFREADAALSLVTLISWVSAALTLHVTIQRRAWWLWLLSLHGQETAESKWTWQLAKLLGLRADPKRAADLFGDMSPSPGADV